MTITATITPMPTPPSRFLTAQEFEDAWDAYLTAQAVLVTEQNAMADDINAFASAFSASYSAAVVYKLTGTQASTSVTLVDVTQLVASVAANGVYEVEASITFQSAATTTGAAIGFTSPAGSNPRLRVEVPVASGGVSTALVTNFPAAASTTAGSVIGTGVTAINSNHTATVRGTLIVGATAGNFAIQFATEVAASAITLQIGSTLVLRRIA